jgi:hypothetical protein
MIYVTIYVTIVLSIIEMLKHLRPDILYEGKDLTNVHMTASQY